MIYYHWCGSSIIGEISTPLSHDWSPLPSAKKGIIPARRSKTDASKHWLTRGHVDTPKYYCTSTGVSRLNLIHAREGVGMVLFNVRENINCRAYRLFHSLVIFYQIPGTWYFHNSCSVFHTRYLHTVPVFINSILFVFVTPCFLFLILCIRA